MVYPALLPLMRIPWLPVVDWTDAPANLNGLVRPAERQNLVSVHVPSQFERGVPSGWKLWLYSVYGSKNTQLVTVITTLLVTVVLSSWWHWLYPCDENTNCCLPGLSLLLPLLSSQRVLSRLYSVVLSLIVPFLLLSASHEGLFILALILNMFCWLLLELHSADSANNKVISQGLLYCTCGVRHFFHMAASFIKVHKLHVFRESRDKWSK
jgi:hypothetical protein